MGDQPEILYRSAPMDNAQAVGDKRDFFPIYKLKDTCRAFRQDFEQLSSAFTSLPLNTPHPDDGSFFLQDESEGNDRQAYIRQWTRTYYQIPGNWSTAGTFAPTFPGFPGYIVLPNSSATQGRNPFTPTGGVDCKIYYEYFMVGTSQTYASELDIPLYPVQKFYFTANPTLPCQSVVPAAGLSFGDQYWLPTTPTQEEYKTWIANATADGWDSGKVWLGETDPGQFVVQSTREQLAGNIWARVTRAVLAQ